MQRPASPDIPPRGLFRPVPRVATYCDERSVSESFRDGAIGLVLRAGATRACRTRALHAARCVDRFGTCIWAIAPRRACAWMCAELSESERPRALTSRPLHDAAGHLHRAQLSGTRQEERGDEAVQAAHWADYMRAVERRFFVVVTLL